MLAVAELFELLDKVLLHIAGDRIALGLFLGFFLGLVGHLSILFSLHFCRESQRLIEAFLLLLRGLRLFLIFSDWLFTWLWLRFFLHINQYLSRDLSYILAIVIPIRITALIGT